MNFFAAALLVGLTIPASAGANRSTPVQGPKVVAMPSVSVLPAALPAAFLPGSMTSLPGVAGAAKDPIEAAKAALLPKGAAQPIPAAAPNIHALANGGAGEEKKGKAVAPEKSIKGGKGAKKEQEKKAEETGSREDQSSPLDTLRQLGRERDVESGELEKAAEEAFDGNGQRAGAEIDHVSPKFEPPTNRVGGPEADEDEKEGTAPEKRLSLSFQPAQSGGLIAVEPHKAIYGSLKRVRAFEASNEYWNKYKKGVEVDVVIRGQNVYGRPTKVTFAVTKKIGDLTREDLNGVLPEYQLQAPIRELRKFYVDQLETARKTWNPNDPEVTLATRVRVVKFQSYLQLYKEAHGEGAIPEVEKPQPRAPLVVKAEGVLEPLTRFLPRAVFLDVDALDGPITPQLLSDMMKLQRTGVYFVAFSRKPYADAGSIREKLTSKMSAYQLSILMPIRFMAVTDNGAVVSHLPRGGNVVPVSIDELTPAMLDTLRDSANQISIDQGVVPYSLKELAQTPIKERVEEFPGRERSKKGPRGPQVRYELLLPKSMTEAKFSDWRAAFEKRIAAQGLKVKTQVVTDEAGRRLYQVQKTELGEAMPRVLDALGEQFGLYLNPSDILVLSSDPALTKTNPHLDFAGVTGLKGSEMIENALGLLLGEHRVTQDGDLAGSASRMTQFSRDRTRYMSEFLVKQDGQEQNIHFFSGHAVHSSQDWLVHQLQNGKRPTIDEYETELRRRWDAGIREFKAVGVPDGHDMEGWERESVARGRNMYQQVLRIHDRGEILIGTEIPNFFMLKDYAKRTEEQKRRYTLHTIFDFVALRPIPGKPGHAEVVIYDFKTGPAQSRQKLNKDLQVMTYALFAKLKWVGKTFQTPYMSGGAPIKIDGAKIEFIYGAIKQPTTITDWDLEFIRKKIISILNRINAAEQKLMAGPAERRAAAKKAAERRKKAAAKKRAAARSAKK